MSGGTATTTVPCIRVERDWKLTEYWTRDADSGECHLCRFPLKRFNCGSHHDRILKKHECFFPKINDIIARSINRQGEIIANVQDMANDVLTVHYKRKK